MPFRSEKQRKFMWANHPEIAKRWTDEYGSKVRKKKKKPTKQAGTEGRSLNPQVQLQSNPGQNPITKLLQPNFSFLGNLQLSMPPAVQSGQPAIPSNQQPNNRSTGGWVSGGSNMVAGLATDPVQKSRLLAKSKVANDLRQLAEQERQETIEKIGNVLFKLSVVNDIANLINSANQ